MGCCKNKGVVMPSRPTIPARQIEAICAALRPGQRAEITMPGGGTIAITSGITSEPADAAPTEAATVHDLAASIKARLAGNIGHRRNSNEKV